MNWNNDEAEPSTVGGAISSSAYIYAWGLGLPTPMDAIRLAADADARASDSILQAIAHDTVLIEGKGHWS